MTMDSIKEWFKDYSYLIIIIVLVIAVFFAAIYRVETDNREEQESTEKFNNGICLDCGGRFVFHQAIAYRIRYSGYCTWLYICDGCGEAVELSHYVNVKKPNEKE